MILLPNQPENKFPIYARSKWEIPQEKPDVVDPKQMTIKAEFWKVHKPKAVMRSKSNFPYNCVGLVFASRRAWIEIDYIYQILQEDGYREIAENEVTVGDVVLYQLDGVPCHVGLIIAADRIRPDSAILSIKVLSKWGKDPEFIHDMNDVPYWLGVASQFFTDRA